jgi:hypothetical protein
VRRPVTELGWILTGNLVVQGPVFGLGLASRIDADRMLTFSMPPGP